MVYVTRLFPKIYPNYGRLLKGPSVASLKGLHFAFFSDETKDITLIEQLAICTTFDREGKICEHFIIIIPLSQMAGTPLFAENIMKALVGYFE